MHIILVHRGDVVEDVLFLREHALEPALNDDREFVSIRRVVGDTVGNCAGQQVTVAILMLQSFAVECGATRRRTDQKTTGLGVPRRPGQVADALEAEHGIENVKRDHREPAGGVGGGMGQPGRKSAGFVDALLHDLPLDILLVKHDLAGILWRVTLTHGRIDTELAKHALHAEGTRLVGDDRYDPLTDGLVLHQS